MRSLKLDGVRDMQELLYYNDWTRVKISEYGLYFCTVERKYINARSRDSHVVLDNFRDRMQLLEDKSLK